MQKKVLITNIEDDLSIQILKSFDEILEAKEKLTLFCGSKEITSFKEPIIQLSSKHVKFDLLDISTFSSALEGINSVYLSRPKFSSEIIKDNLLSFLNEARKARVRHIVLVSIEEYDKTDFISFEEIEKLIKAIGLNYTFIHSDFLMQDFLKNRIIKTDLLEKRKIVLPSSTTKFAFIDERDIAAIAANVLCNSRKHHKRVYEINNAVKLDLKEIASKFSFVLGIKIKYKPLGIIGFYFSKRREGYLRKEILRNIRLYFFGRFKSYDGSQHLFEKITEKVTIPFDQFIRDYKEQLILHKD